MTRTAKIALAIGIGLILLMWVCGCGEPGERPYCAVCDATGLCKYEPFEREDAAAAKAAFWGGQNAGSPRELPPISPLPPLPPMR